MDVLTAKNAVSAIVANLDEFIVEPATPAKFVTQCRRFKQALQNYVATMGTQTTIPDAIERENATDNGNN